MAELAEDYTGEYYECVAGLDVAGDTQAHENVLPTDEQMSGAAPACDRDRDAQAAAAAVVVPEAVWVGCLVLGYMIVEANCRLVAVVLQSFHGCLDGKESLD